MTKVPTAKIQALRQSGTLHPRAEKVQDRLFLEESFFDPQDLTQVKYEMLRRVQKDEIPISTVAANFGVSRPAFYKAQRDFARAGLVGLIPRRRGPKHGHKLTGEVLAFVKYIRTQEPDMTTPELVRRIQKKFSFQVHRRTVERALSSAKKKQNTDSSSSCLVGFARRANDGY
jgi:transposase